MQTDQLVDNMGQGQKQGQDNPLRGMKKMMSDDKINDGWRMTSDNERQGVDEEEHVMWDKNEDYYARKKRGQLGRYATIDVRWWPREQAAIILD